MAQLTKVLGAEHPDTLVCQANLAVTLREAGRDREAKDLRAKVLADLARVLGARDIRTLSSSAKVSASIATWSRTTSDSGTSGSDSEDSQRRMSGSTSSALKCAAPAWTTTVALAICCASHMAWLTGNRLSTAPCQSRTGTVTVAGSNPQGR